MKRFLFWILLFVVVLVLASSCSSSDGTSVSPGTANCGQRELRCCVGDICASGLACRGGECVSLDAEQGGASGDSSTDPSAGHADGGTGPSCGVLGAACCAGEDCSGVLTCRSGTCQNAPSNGTGTQCGKNSDCPSGICLPIGNGNVCTTTCSSAAACVAGWKCGALIGQSSNICQCNASPESCDGLDNDCDGIIDDEPAIEASCRAIRGPAYVCKEGACVCPLTCGGQCVNVKTDSANCGGCGATCPSGGACHGGTCICPAGETSCGGTCVNKENDVNNCGACGNKCTATGQTCQGGACVCPAGGVPCGGACVNEKIDADNCGACSNKCLAAQNCQGGVCTCPGGRVACSGACVDVETDAGNCGACGNTCSAEQDCRVGKCACLSGQTTCPAPKGCVRAGIQSCVVTNGCAVVTTAGCSSGLVCEAAGGPACVDPNWAEWPMPNDPSSGSANLETYVDNKDGTVTDNVTGLMWQQTVTTATYTRASAVAHCQGFALGGHADWRLPTVIELVSIVDYDQKGPAINDTIFPATPNTEFWSATPQAGSLSYGWVVEFYAGSTIYADVSRTADVRCVR